MDNHGRTIIVGDVFGPFDGFLLGVENLGHLFAALSANGPGTFVGYNMLDMARTRDVFFEVAKQYG